MSHYRITLDIDTKKKKALRRAENVLRKFKFTRIQIKPSPSKNGFHVIAWRKQPLSEFAEFIIRIRAGDDLRRLWWDLKKDREKQVLFDEKTVEIIKQG